MPTWFRRRRRTRLGTEADRTTFRTLHTASLASPALREGLNASSAARSIHHLRALLGAQAVALTDTEQVLAWDGAGQHHEQQAAGLARSAVSEGSTQVADRSDLPCDSPGCPIRHAIVKPLVVEDRIIGTLQVFSTTSSAGLVRAADEVSTWVTGQLELAELDASRRRLMEAEVRALRAQISPHFIYNSLGAIASFVRTDPDRARELLLEFADFTRYSFRRHGEYTTLAEELRSIERYLLLEQARFGDRLEVTLRVAPEVLPVTLPFLCLQPRVERAARHGLAGTAGAGTPDTGSGAGSETGRITIAARDQDTECVIEVEDNGVGEDPERVRRLLAGDFETDDHGHASIGLGNVDARLRNTFGDDYGLVVETAPHAGTKVVVRVPKFAPGVHA